MHINEFCVSWLYAAIQVKIITQNKHTETRFIQHEHKITLISNLKRVSISFEPLRKVARKANKMLFDVVITCFPQNNHEL